jgi:hypothetical protein
MVLKSESRRAARHLRLFPAVQDTRLRPRMAWEFKPVHLGWVKAGTSDRFRGYCLFPRGNETNDQLPDPHIRCWPEFDPHRQS